MNKIFLIGRTGKAPEIKNLEAGKVAKFTLAVSEKVTRDGEKKEETEWFNIAAFGKLAEVCENYVHKGDRICVIGKYKTREYTDKDGAKKTFSEVLASDVELLGSKSEGEEKSKQEASIEVQAPVKRKELPPEDDLPF